jgi:hypothetical protein
MSKQVFYKKVIKSIMANDYFATIEECVEATEADLAEAGYVKREKVRPRAEIIDDIVFGFDCPVCSKGLNSGDLFCRCCGAELDWEGE